MGAAARGHAVVIGGSMAGLLAARVLKDHFAAVTVVERNAGIDGKGVPQASHVHGLLVSGQRVLERLFPGFGAEVLAAGFAPFRYGHGVGLTRYGWLPRTPLQSQTWQIGRRPLERQVRRRVLDAGVGWLIGVAGQLRADPSGCTVTGVEVDTADGRRVLEADLVVDAGGRGSAAVRRVRELGFPEPAETVIDAGTGYASCAFRGRFTEVTGSYVVLPDPPRHHRGAFAFADEPDTLLVTLNGVGGDHPPRDWPGFVEFARSLRASHVHQLVTTAERISDISLFRSMPSRVRHWESVTDRPQRFLVVGDAACAVNPIYGQGMSMAALSAQELDRQLRRARPDLNGLAASFQRHSARLNYRAWAFASSEDYRVPTVLAPPPARHLRTAQRICDAMFRYAMHDRVWFAQIAEVAGLEKSTAGLFRPDLLARLAWTALRLRNAGASFDAPAFDEIFLPVPAAA